MGIAAFLFIMIFAFMLGFGLISRMLPGMRVTQRILIGFVSGIILNVWSMNIPCYLFGIRMSCIVGAQIAIVIAIFFIWRKRWSLLGADLEALVNMLRVAPKSAWITNGLYFLFFLFVMTSLHHSVLVMNDQGMYCGIANNLGDLPLHISYITSFAWGDNYPPQNPIFAGHALRYPVLMDFFSAVLLRLGMSLHQVLFLPGLLLSLSIVGLLYSLVFNLTGKKWLALLGPVMLFFNGNPGFVQFFHDFTGSELTALEFFSNIPRNFSFVPEHNIQFYNLTVALLLPQRSLLLGIPLGISVLLLWLEGYKNSGRQPFILSGLLTGLCPFAHMHTFICLVILSGFYGLLSRNKKWLIFYAIACLLSLGQVLSFSASAEHSMGIQLGWMAGDDNLAWFWLKNLGIFLPLFLLSFYFLRNNRVVRDFSLGLLGLFVLANLFRLANWEWDNIKLFAWFYIGAIPSGLYALSSIWTTLRNALPVRMLGKPIATVGFTACLLSMTLVGFTDVARAMDYETQMQFLFSKQEIDATREIMELTAPKAVFLAAPTYDHFLSLAGRQRILGYPSHIISHGIDLGSREYDVLEMYAGNRNSIRLLKKYKPDYIVLGRHEYALRANEAFFDELFQSILTKRSLKVYSTFNLKDLDPNMLLDSKPAREFRETD